MEDKIKQQFDDMGIEPAQDVLNKCADLALIYNIDDATEFVEKWMAFSLTNLQGADPSTSNLDDFERKVLQSKREQNTNVANKNFKSMPLSEQPLELNPLAMYGVDDTDDMYISEITSNDTTQIQGTPKTKPCLPITPMRHKNISLFSPASYSPLSATKREQSNVPCSGDIVYTFGNPKLMSNTQWSTQKTQQVIQHPITVKQVLTQKGEPLTADKIKFMFDNLYEKTEIALERILNIGEALIKNAFVSDTNATGGADAEEFDWDQLDKGIPDNIEIIGSILCDYDGPLDQYSTLLAVPDKYGCRYLELNFTKMKSFCVFPGQTVMLRGTNPQHDMFVVEKLYTERKIQPPLPLRVERALSFVVAAGPFTSSDDILYEPLHNLLKYLQNNNPDVLILIGPFLEHEHKIISENNTLAETLDCFFEKMIAGIIDAVGSITTILIVSSQKDINAYPVYPTPPIVLRKTYLNVHMLADPSIIDLDGITVGITATDVVDHLLSSEVAVNAGDKVKRIVNYLIHQRTFYPLNPPADENMCYDSQLSVKYATLEQLPNVLILPSIQKCFIRAVDGCLVINPGKLADNQSGTFARFIVSPTIPHTDEINLFNCVGCQICRV